MDIRPPRPVKPPQRPTPPPIDRLPRPQIADIATEYVPTPSPSDELPVKRRIWTPRRLAIVSSLAALILVMLASVIWYYWALSPRDSGDKSPARVIIDTGDGSQAIAQKLQQKGLIRSATAFRIYTEISGTKSKLQAGGYALSPSFSVQEIVQHIVSGKTDEFNITILPGLTLAELRPYLKDSGYSDEEIDRALQAPYENPVLVDRPAEASLEGYIFPDTYRMNAHDSLEVLFSKSFDNLEARLKTDNLVDAFKAQGLNLHQALTLASIIQKEVSKPEDQKQVAQVFLKRLHEGMLLGSDVTFYYAAKQLGVTPSVNIDSPYNTRKYGGLPPGPIANMNLSALEAVAHPAPGDYLFFVAGDGADSGKTYFAHTEAEHQANIAAHCHELCR